MALLTNAQTSFATIGNREDLIDKIFMISPTETPFMANIGKKKATATNHEWQTDALAAPAANAAIEGNEFSATAFTPTVRLGNRTQISTCEFAVTGTQNAVNPAGRTRESVYQMMKASKKLKTDMEFVLTNNQVPTTGTTTVAQLLRPLVGFYHTNIVDSTTGFVAGTSTTAATDGGTTAALTEANVLTAHREAVSAGGNPDTVLLSPTNKVAFSGFTGPSNTYKTVQADAKKLYNTISVYISDFGELRIIYSRISRPRDVHILDTSTLAVAYLRPFQTLDIAKTGDSDKGKVVVEYTLEQGNEAASALVADTAG